MTTTNIKDLASNAIKSAMALDTRGKIIAGVAAAVGAAVIGGTAMILNSKKTEEEPVAEPTPEPTGILSFFKKKEA